MEYSHKLDERETNHHIDYDGAHRPKADKVEKY